MGNRALPVRSRPAFVGRRAESDRLLRQWEETVTTGLRRTVLVGGEPGVGKSALLRRIAELAAEKDATVFYGVAEEATAPYQLWLDALRPTGIVDTFRDIVANVSDPATGRSLVFEAVVDAVAASAPALLLLDDVQRADDSSLALARHLARGSAPLPVMVVLAYRDTDVGPSLATTVSDLAVTPACERMALLGLTTDEVRDLTGRDDSEWLREYTAGNPFLIGAVDDHDEAGPPPLVADLVGGWVTRLGADARDVVCTAAVCGRVVTVELVERLVGERALDGLIEAAAAGLLIPDGDDRYAFVHDLVRESIADAIPPARRARVHAAVAEALGATGASAASIDSHRIGAGGDDAFGAALSAADRARAAHAYETAAAHRRVALELAGDPELRYDIALGLAEDLALSGSIAGEREALMLAITAARALGDPMRVADAVARTPLGYGETEDCTSLIEDALADLPPGDSHARARLLLRKFYEDTNSHYPADVLAALDEAVAIATRTGDVATLARAVVTTSIFIPDRVTEADLELLAQNEAAMAAVYGARTLRRSRVILITRRMALGDIDGARRAVAALSESGLSEASRWTVCEWRSLEAFLGGRFDDALRLAADASRMGAALGEDFAVSNLDLLRNFVAIERGDSLDPESMRGVALGVLSAVDDVFVARACLANGDTARARSLLEGIDLLELVQRATWGPLLFTCAEVVAAVGDSGRAASLLDLLAPFAGTVVVPPMVASLSLGAADRMLGQLAVAAGRLDEARRLFSQALTLDTRIGADVWAAHDRHHLGRLLLDEEPERAAALLEVAASEAQRMGMRPLLHRVNEARSRAVFRRDREGWVVAYEGRVVRLPHRRGFEALAVLLSQPGAEVSALQLVGGGSVDRPPAIDDEAKSAYRRRLRELDAALDAAAVADDAARADRVRVERDALLDELRRAVGLGGRDRTLGADSERARLSVTKAVRRALSEIEVVHPTLAAHLLATIRTGSYCAYTPDPRQPPTWHTA